MNATSRQHRSVRVMLLVVLAAALIAGNKFRHRFWDATFHFRFEHDIVNAHAWGTHAQRSGFFNVYDAWVRGEDLAASYQFDYAPLRLLAATLWVRWLHQHYPDLSGWENQYRYTRPLLYVNRAAELASAAGIFFLVFVLYRRRNGARASDTQGTIDQQRERTRRTLLATVATLLFWFNPALLLNAHGWPQWDVWLLPFFLWAVILARRSTWTGVGLLLVTGAMLKGQLLIVSPFFLFWALCTRRLANIVRFLGGAVLAATVIGSPWLIKGAAGAISVLAVCGTVLALGAALYLRGRLRAITVWYVLEGVVPCAILLAYLVFDGSFAWFEVAFMQSIDQFSGNWTVGMAANLPAIIEDVFGCTYTSSVPVAGLCSLRLTTALNMLCLAGLMHAGWVAHRHNRSGDHRFLLAVVMPWVLMYTVLPQMHERYLVYGASLSALWVCLGLGPLLAHVFLTLLSVLAMMHTMLSFTRAYRQLGYTVRATHPDAAWGLCVLVVALWIVMSRNLLRASRGSATPGATPL